MVTSQRLLLTAFNNCAGDNVTRLEGPAGNLHSATKINVARHASLSNSSISLRRLKNVSLWSANRISVCTFYTVHHPVSEMAFRFSHFGIKRPFRDAYGVHKMATKTFKALSRRNKAKHCSQMVFKHCYMHCIC